jgi:putative tricarboxylic transport membrane protein
VRRLRSDVVIGCVLIVFCVGIYLIIPNQIPELMRYDASMGLSPAVFPKLAVFLIAGFSIVLIFHDLRSKTNAPVKTEVAIKLGSKTRIVTTFIILIAYVFLIDILGYFVTTPITIGVLMWYFGERNWFLIPSIAILTTAGLFGFFRYIMYIILPKGILFF